LVHESCERPAEYFRNNVQATVNVVEAALSAGCRSIIHSSSCAVYGIPPRVPIAETDPIAPITPYGETKWMSERVLDHFADRKGIRVVHLRYFNPAGALGALGEEHEPETHLVPNIVRAAMEDRAVRVYGNDYPTPDGTCVRDYVHVEDLAAAHLAALRALAGWGASGSRVFNVGGGRGTSVLEVVAAASKALGKKVDVEISPRRPGDPPALVANASRALAELGWKPLRSLVEIVTSHHAWLKGRAGA